jgi:cellulose biosynthesis protein BcsQ
VSRLLETARIAEANYRPRLSAPRGHRRYRVISVVSNKGGVGKTTVATNLAVYLRSLYEDLPILMLALDEQPTLDRMFAIDRSRHPEDIVTAMRNADLTGAIRLGQYGIHYVQPSAGIHELKLEINDPFHLDRMLRANDWPGLVIIDTKSDLEILTRNAILASDLSLVLVSDHASLIEAHKVFDLLNRWRLPQERARVLLSLVDRRIKYAHQDARDVLGLLLSEIRSCGYPLFDSFVSRSAKVESLLTNPERRAFSILHGAPQSVVDRQMRHLAREVMVALSPSTAGVASSNDPMAHAVQQ